MSQSHEKKNEERLVTLEPARLKCPRGHLHDYMIKSRTEIQSFKCLECDFEVKYDPNEFIYREMLR